jgi:hypothetical protein
MLLIVGNCVGDGAAQHVKGIIFGVVDLQDPKGFSDVVADHLLVGGGLSFFDALRDHRQRIYFGHSRYFLSLFLCLYITVSAV